ncbi:MAG: GFA family protein [Polyangiaceae bacterium]|nr:GFA family protein [Polyangiaceae bacterium]
MEERSANASNLSGKKTYKGSCHCGAIRFEVELDLAQTMVGRCNCSICTKVSPTGAIVKPEALKIVAGEDKAGQYKWGPEISTRYFCKNCGVHCYGRGHLAELGGDYASVNLNVIDEIDVSTLKIVYWDGRHNNWQGGPKDKPWPIHTGA